VARSKEIKKPVMFSGGVAANTGMIRAFNEILELKENELLIPTYHASMGAIGAVMYARSNKLEMNHFAGLEKLNSYLNDDSTSFVTLSRLKESDAVYCKDIHRSFDNNQTPGSNPERID
jgi:tRNA A37 threonylcarbamoyltransferase TsaD